MNSSPPPSAQAPLRPREVGFWVERIEQTEEKQICTVAMCFATVDSTWAALTENHATRVAIRRGRFLAGASSKISWYQRAAPQLSAPLDGEPASAESTLAAMVRRLPLQFSVATLRTDGTLTEMTNQHWRSLVHDALLAYAVHLKTTRTMPCKVLVTPPRPATSILPQLIRGEILQLTDSYELGALSPEPWTGEGTPLGLELCELAAASVARHFLHPRIDNAVYDAIKARKI